MEDQPMENEIPLEPGPEMESEPQPTGGPAARITGEYVHFGPGIAGGVSAQQDAAVDRAAAFGVAVGRDLNASMSMMGPVAVGRDLVLDRGGGALLVVGQNTTIDRGGSMWMINGNSVTIDRGGAGVMITGNEVRASRSNVGVLLSANVQLDDSSRVLLSTPQAIAFGAAFGVVFALMRWLFRR